MTRERYLTSFPLRTKYVPSAKHNVNTVGNGDSLVAGFTAVVLQGLPVPEALASGAVSVAGGWFKW